LPATKYALPAILIAALVLAAAPVTLALKHSSTTVTDGQDEHDDTNETTSVVGKVTAFLYGHDDDSQTDQDHEDNEVSRACAFVIDNSTVVEFGPWWYWMNQTVNVTSVVHVGDMVNVTGELEREDNTTVLEAWHIDNLTTGKELTIKEEGRPPWAGGPKGLAIYPWPPSDEDD